MNQPAFERDGEFIAREDFYAIACDPHRHVAVEACAGAGKTWMLVSRILRALLDGAQPHEILAITFTKKAAGEMRGRLMEWLEDFSKASPEKLLEELRIRGVSEAQAQALQAPLKGLYAQVLSAGRAVQIRTFHSWFAALLRACPLSVLESLGLPAQFELLEDDAQAVAAVWRLFYAALLQDEAARADYTAVVTQHGRSQTEKALTAALARRIEFTLADEAKQVLASVAHFSELFPELKAWDEPMQAVLQDASLRQSLSQAAKLLGQAPQKTFSAAGSALEQALSAGDVNGVHNSLFTQKNEARKFSDKVAGIDEVRATQAKLERLLQAQAQHEAWLYQQRMTRLTRLLIQVFSQLKRDRGWVDMNDVEHAAWHLLSDTTLGGWVQERLDARTRYLLVDEFQDTNPLQWQALSAWLSAYAGAGGGATPPSVFLVGDPKQSIYRFRRAEPQVFIAAKAFVREHLQGTVLSCDHTRRNAPQVVALVNQAMLQAQNDQAFEGYRPHTTESKDTGAVQCLPPVARPGKDGGQGDDAAPDWRDSLTVPRETPEDTLSALECQQAAGWVAQEIAQGTPAQHIMVMARKRERLVAMNEALRARHVPAQLVEKMPLCEVPVVQDLIALLDALVSTGNDLALARALKSPVFGLGDDDLMVLARLQRADPTRPPWFDLLQKGSGLTPALAPVGAVLARWQSWLASRPPHDALEEIYQDGDVVARCVAAAPAALRASTASHVQALLAAALQMDGARYATPYTLVRSLKSAGLLAPTPALSEAVQLLTVHGAKGLEADLVLLLDTDPAPPKSNTMTVLVDWPGQDSRPRRFVFLTSESKVPPSVQDMMDTERQERSREELNALYVAMTRARQRLVLSAVEPAKAASVSSWWQRLHAQCEPLVPVPGELPQAAMAQSQITLPQLPALSRPLPDTASSAPASLVSRIGQAMHRLLEWAPMDTRTVADPAVRAVAAAFDLDAQQAAQAADMAQRILQGQAAWAWDSAQVRWHGNEVNIIVAGQLRRIDRLVQHRDGDWWVLDHKSAGEPLNQPELIDQLRHYQQAVQALYPQHTVRAAFLSAQGTVHTLEPLA